jgi:3-dehydroquinate dehydratase/shikimate dehydrogenase
MSLLCETVTGASTAALLAARDAAMSRAPGLVPDMVELRLDGVADLDVAAALHGRVCPAIVTCRAAWEGGRFDGSEDERRQILLQALDRGAEYVDVEWRAGFVDVIARDPRRVVVSAHDFTRKPADLTEQVRAMRATGAATIKVAYAAARLGETLALREIARDGAAVVIAMGEAGLPSRILASRYESMWTYGGNGLVDSAGRAVPVAPGQIPVTRMLDLFRFQAIGPATRLFGVVSQQARHSISPALHNRAFAAAGIDAVYVPLSTDSFDDFLAFADALGLEGASVTIPFKVDALRAADRADSYAMTVGAANTLRRRGSGWEAANTDVEGFLEPLADIYPDLRGVRAAVLGAGGSARAVISGLVGRGAVVTVAARRGVQAREVAATLGAATGSWPPHGGSWDVLVNCTPLGGGGRRDESPLPGYVFDGRVVYDLTYGAGDSALLREARANGCTTLDGLPMLIAQAERQFEWWTGARAVPGVMRAAADAAVGRNAVATARQQ